MPNNVKALIVVLAISALVLRFAKPVVLQFTGEADYKRRRNAWLALSVAAFLSPSFWLFVLIASPILYWGGKRDTNPLAYFLQLMLVIPSMPIQIPTAGLGINELFGLDIFRLAALCVLVPAALRIRATRNSATRLKLPDGLLLAYGFLQAAQFIPPDLPNHVLLHNSSTTELRTVFLFLVDAYVLYYVASRLCTNRRAMTDAMAAFSVACCVMAAMATFESLKHWLLYSTLNIAWGGNPLDTQYILRAGLLRAEASAGSSLALGYLLAIAFGFWLYLQGHIASRIQKLTVIGLLWLGLFASFSRGPWLGALVIYFSYPLFGPRRAFGVAKAAALFLCVGGIVLSSPIGDRISSSLPFLGGSIGSGTITYRERLMDRSWELIKARPLFGDQLALTKMQNLRQGQGIIDIVNTYIDVTLFHGFVGLALFLSLLLYALEKARRKTNLLRSIDEDATLLGASLVACILGTLIMLADCSFIQGYAQMFYVLAGLAIAYATSIDATDVTAVSLGERLLESR